MNLPISPYSVTLTKAQLAQMRALVNALYTLSHHKNYQNSLPAALYQPPNRDAVMMGYDFHLSAGVPKLIEVNTNAGGLWLACLACQPDATTFPTRLARRLVAMFLAEYAQFCQSPQATPRCIGIVDANPCEQFLYPEMQQFRALLTRAGIATFICDPQDLHATPKGLYYGEQRVDLIYNRHCDFYLSSPAMQAIRHAWQQGLVCLTPNPYVYHLLADKQRMILWSNAKQRQAFALPCDTEHLLAASLPQTQWLASLSLEQAWQTRKQWVFKPDTGYASRGVYVGDKLTKGKLAQLNPHTTLMQQRIVPTQLYVDAQTAFKIDFRLFVYQNRLLAITARLYQGQVTNLRTENGGFARVVITH